ncbi:ribonuclease HI family protein [bacterium]
MDITKILRTLADGKSLEYTAEMMKCSKEKVRQEILTLAEKYSQKPENIVIIGKPKKDGIIKVYTDGAVKGNPGAGGIGCVLYNSGKEEIAYGKKFIDHATNNAAEYMAVIFSFKIISKFEKIKEIHFYTDSELLARQVQGIYKVSNQVMQAYYMEFIKKIKKYKTYTITSILRSNNKRADALANEAYKQGKNLQAFL